jgi:23S rRNA (pseudouridine1915-N3)-methyltransferase
MKITILAVGRLKEPHWRAAQREYLERIEHFAKIDVRELEEDAQLVAQLPAGAKLVLLDEKAPSLDSEAWAAQVIGEAEMRFGSKGLVFAIGGADGLPEALRPLAWKSISFGKATLPHRLARVVLLEQIYRAFTILRGLPYHRGG